MTEEKRSQKERLKWDDSRKFSERPVFELTKEGARNIAKAMENPGYWEKVLAEHMAGYHAFLKEHNIKVR